jgi:hypothetical protein
MILKPCDIVFTRSSGFLGRMIRFFTRRKGESKTITSHVGIITYGSDLWNSTIVEAQTHTNRHSMQEAYGSSDTELCIFRPKNLTNEQVEKIVAKAESYVGDDYGYLKLLAYAADWCLGERNVFRRLCRIDSRPICSYLVARSYEAAGLDFGVDDYAASPDDILDFCTGNPDKYVFVWQRGNMI